jgi:hypothetical protein
MMAPAMVAFDRKLRKSSHKTILLIRQTLVVLRVDEISDRSFGDKRDEEPRALVK